MKKLRVAILGGGCAGVAAAFHLSRTAERRERFAVSLYQMDHRLGGKGATGRDPERAMRIEEHGLHLWMGFYTQAFTMMKECFDALEPPEGSPLRNLDDAFEPSFRVSFADGDRPPWTLSLPPRPGLPWEPAPSLLDDLRHGALARFTRAGVWQQVFADAGADRAASWRHAKTMARLSRVIVRGLVRDALPGGFDALDEHDLRAWLRRHGADDELASAPPVNALYDLAFAYPDGHSGRGRGDVAAGAALRAMLRIAFGYRGAPFWRMRFGMGDTVFAPLYRVLSDRGVRFQFFQRVEGLHLDRAGRRIAAVSLRELAGPAALHYDPLITVRGLPCWPREPRREQLVGGRGAHWLREGHDFDAVILAIPVGALAPLTAELRAANPRFARMIAESRTVGTCALQLWLRPDLASLGWRAGETVLTSRGRPFSSWADMSEVLAAEDWGDAPPRTLAYFCDVCPDDRDRANLTAETERWLDESLTALWPGARDEEGRFDRRHLALAPGRDGEGPLGEQYLRLNLAPEERYVLSPAGSVKHRLWPHESGFDNLALAGDWTRSSIDGGSVEAAVESGRLAAEALEAQREELTARHPRRSTLARGGSCTHA